jgi:tellurite resistance protein TehA-like permease
VGYGDITAKTGAEEIVACGISTFSFPSVTAALCTEHVFPVSVRDRALSEMFAHVWGLPSVLQKEVGLQCLA